MRFRSLSYIFDIENGVVINSVEIILPAGVWISISESITVGRCETNVLRNQAAAFMMLNF